MEERIKNLELLVAVLAEGILLHEYAKDLSRDNVEQILRGLAYGSIDEAIRLIKEA